MLGHMCDMLAPSRFAADFMQAVGAARPARNPHAAQKAVGDVLLRYTSQARSLLLRHAQVLAVHCMSRIAHEACTLCVNNLATTALRRFLAVPACFL